MIFRVTLPEDYFIDENLWTTEEYLDAAKTVRFEAFTLHRDFDADISSPPPGSSEAVTGCGDAPPGSSEAVTGCGDVAAPQPLSPHFILDIDLDYFSTIDPFQSAYNDRQTKLIKTIYNFVAPKSRDIEVEFIFFQFSVVSSIHVVN